VAVSSFVVPGERRHTSSTRDWGSDVCSSDLVLRRVRPESDDDETLRVSDLELDPATYQVSRAGKPVELAPTEYKMLRYLMINANVVLSRQQLLDAVWRTAFFGDDSVVATYIPYLRRKIDTAGLEPLLHTHRGFGYVLRGDRR